jgi:hypothetical protein
MLNFDEAFAEWQKTAKELNNGSEEVFLVSGMGYRYEVWTGNERKMRREPAPWEKAYHVIHGQRVAYLGNEDGKEIHQAAKQRGWREFTLDCFGLERRALILRQRPTSTLHLLEESYGIAFLLFPPRPSL